MGQTGIHRFDGLGKSGASSNPIGLPLIRHLLQKCCSHALAQLGVHLGKVKEFVFQRGQYNRLGQRHRARCRYSLQRRRAP